MRNCEQESGSSCVLWSIDGNLTAAAQALDASLSHVADAPIHREPGGLMTWTNLPCRTKFDSYLQKQTPYSFAVQALSPTGCTWALGYLSVQKARDAAYAYCQEKGLRCMDYASERTVVYREPAPETAAVAGNGMDAAQQTDAVAELVNQAAAAVAQGATDRNAAKQANRDAQQATLLQQQQLQQQRQSSAAQQAAIQNQQHQAYQQQQAATQSPRVNTATPAAPAAHSRSSATAPSAPQSSFTHGADVVVDNNASADQNGQVPNIYSVNVTNTGQVRLYCTADAKAQTYNQTIKCPDPSHCQGVTSWYTNSGSTYVLPGSTDRIVGIRYYAGQGSYTVNCQSSQ